MVSAVLCSFFLGMGALRLWQTRNVVLAEESVLPESASILTVDLDNSVTLGQEADAPVYEDGSKLPSTLAEKPFEGITQVNPASAAEETPAQLQETQPRPVAPVVLKTDKPVVKPLDMLPSVPAEAQDSNITLIQIPVVSKLIKTQEDYKAFKRKARGKYPDVNFNKQMVVVLESANDMPDKVFEIVEVTPQEKQLTVAYRVNIFGLDKKTTTHAVAAVDKTDKPVVLKQVL